MLKKWGIITEDTGNNRTHLVRPIVTKQLNNILFIQIVRWLTLYIYICSRYSVVSHSEHVHLILQLLHPLEFECTVLHFYFWSLLFVGSIIWIIKYNMQIILLSYYTIHWKIYYNSQRQSIKEKNCWGNNLLNNHLCHSYYMVQLGLFFSGLSLKHFFPCDRLLSPSFPSFDETTASSMPSKVSYFPLSKKSTK